MTPNQPSLWKTISSSVALLCLATVGPSFWADASKTQTPGSLEAQQSASVGSSSIGLAKAVTGGPTDNGDGTFTVDLGFVVENLGTSSLINVRVQDDLAVTFPAPVTLVSVGTPIASGTLTANPAYDGVADTELLVASSSSLASGFLETVEISVTFDSNGVSGLYLNQGLTIASIANGPTGGVISDLSDDGTDPDPNGNGQANDPGEDDPTPIEVVIVGSQDIPTLNGLSLALLGALLAVAAILVLSRRRSAGRAEQR